MKWCYLWIVMLFLGSASAQLHAADGTISLSSVVAGEKSVVVRFKGTMERFPGVSSFEVFRTPDTTDQEWEELGRKFEGHSGKTVAIAFSGAPYASRGGHLAFFGKPKIWMEEVK